MTKTLLFLFTAGLLLSACTKKDTSIKEVEQTPQASVAVTSTPVVVESPSPSLTPTPVATIKPSVKPSSKPSVSPSATPDVTTFDLNLEEITLSTGPSAAEPSWGGVYNVRNQGEVNVEKRSGTYAVTVTVRNNGHEPAENVTYEVLVDNVSKKIIKDRIDHGTHHRERVVELPNDDKRHEVKVTVSSARAESNHGNNSHTFTFQIK